jgi:hypothetical protein
MKNLGINAPVISRIVEVNPCMNPSIQTLGLKTKVCEVMLDFTKWKINNLSLKGELCANIKACAVLKRGC